MKIEELKAEVLAENEKRWLTISDEVHWSLARILIEEALVAGYKLGLDEGQIK